MEYIQYKWKIFNTNTFKDTSFTIIQTNTEMGGEKI